MLQKILSTKYSLWITNAIVLISLSSHHFPRVSGECSRRFIVLTIRHEDCLPKRIMALACRGTCTSYVRPSVSLAGDVERFCQCCDADGIRTDRVVVRCPNRDWYEGSSGISRFKGMGLTLSFPTACRCRPCSPMPSQIIPAEMELFEEGKRSKNVTQGNDPDKERYLPNFEDNKDGLDFSSSNAVKGDSDGLGAIKNAILSNSHDQFERDVDGERLNQDLGGTA